MADVNSLPARTDTVIFAMRQGCKHVRLWATGQVLGRRCLLGLGQSRWISQCTSHDMMDQKLGKQAPAVVVECPCTSSQ